MTLLPNPWHAKPVPPSVDPQNVQGYMVRPTLLHHSTNRGYPRDRLYRMMRDCIRRLFSS